MECVVASSSPQRASAYAERERCRRAFEALRRPVPHFDPVGSALGFCDAFRYRRMLRPADITDVDALWDSRVSRATDLEEHEKARLRMLLRELCRRNATAPGRFVARHPRVVRGPNSRGPIHLADSPVGLMRA
jgi:hypothetical protein